VADPVGVTLLAEVLWGALHGLVSLKLTCPIFPSSSVEELVETLTGLCSRQGTKR
jgi:uncharacterized phosphosugar-binding protein